MLRSIGPVWDGNEVWLLAAGGTLYFAFPALYAASFSGFYLPLMIVLLMPGRSTTILARLHRLVTAHAKTIGGGLAAVFGVYLSIKGIGEL